MTHTQSQINHTKKRFWHRFGIRISWKEQTDLINQIQTRRSMFIGRISKKKTNHLVELRGEVYLVGYDKRTKRISTVLPTKCLREVYSC